jgi:hypothetical protein
MVMNTHNDDFNCQGEWGAPPQNHIIPRERRSVKSACIIALGVIFYGTAALASILAAALVIYELWDTFKRL